MAIAFTTPIGTVGIEASQDGLRRVRLPGEDQDRQPVDPAQAGGVVADAASQLVEYLEGDRTEFELDLDWAYAGAEHRHVLEILRELAPFGTTVTYGELGRQAGVSDPREVGALMGRNPLPLVIPCHRVVAAEGLGGYGGGLELKRRLLELEGILPQRLDLGVL